MRKVLRFFGTRATSSSKHAKSMTSKVSTENIENTMTEGQKALLEIKQLYNSGDYKAAWIKLAQVEQDFPGCAKATMYYRGVVGEAMLDEDPALDLKGCLS